MTTTSTTEPRCAATATLFGVHFPGDELIPVPSGPAGEVLAAELNSLVAGDEAVTIAASAHVDVWTGSREQHQQQLSELALATRFYLYDNDSPAVHQARDYNVTVHSEQEEP